MKEKEAGYSAKMTAEQINDAIDIVRQLMLISLDTTKIILYGKYGIDIDGQESKKSETTNLSE